MKLVDYDSDRWLPMFLLTWKPQQTVQERLWVLRHYFVAWPLCAARIRRCAECRANAQSDEIVSGNAND